MLFNLFVVYGLLVLVCVVECLSFGFVYSLMIGCDLIVLMFE